MNQAMEYNDTSQCDMEQVDLCLEEEPQERETNSEECATQEEQNSNLNVNVENEIGDKQNETECPEEMQMVSRNKTVDNIWEMVRENTKAAIKCEVKGSIVSRAIDIKLQELSVKREEQKVEIQELISQDNIINEHLRSEFTNQAPLQTEVEKTDIILSFLNDQILHNEERYQQLERGRKELDGRVEAMMNYFHKYETEKQKEFEGLLNKIQETNEDKLVLDHENEMIRLKQELVTAEGSLQDTVGKNAEIKRRIEEIESECETHSLNELQEKREEINKEINEIRMEDLEQQEIMEERGLKEQLGVMQQNLKSIETIFVDEVRSLNANREKLEENRVANSAHLGQFDDIKQSLEKYKADHEEKQQEIEEMKLNYDSKLQEACTKVEELEIKLSSLESDITIINKETVDLSSKLTELKNQRDEASSNENKLKLQKRQLEHDLEENLLLFVKYDEQSKSFSALDSLQATYDEAMKKYTCEVDEELLNLQERKQRVIAELEEIKEKFSSSLKDQQKEFDDLVENTKKETCELQEKGEQDLKEAQLQSTAAMEVLNIAKAKFRRLQQQYNGTIRKRDALGKNLNVLKSQNTKENHNQQSLVGILKNVGKRTPEKKVRFDPTGPNWETLSENSAENIFNIRNKLNNIPETQRRANSFFDDLLRNSPPVREKSVSKNQSMFD